MKANFLNVHQLKPRWKMASELAYNLQEQKHSQSEQKLQTLNI